jgi:mannose-6-phosphate isomerase-like protein (cupin superfamily)
MPKQSATQMAHIKKEEWIKSEDPPKGVFEGHQYGVNCVVIRYSVDKVGEGPNMHIHPYDELFHITKGRARFTVGDKIFIAEEGAMVVGPANIPHTYKNAGPGRLDSVDIHLNDEWIQYDMPQEGEKLSAPGLEK